MKTLLIFALALFATSYAYSIDDIPDFMKERLDKFIVLKNTWDEKWYAMSQDERNYFEKMIYDRLQHIPEHVKERMRSRIEEMDPEDQVKLLDYLYQRFPELEETSESQNRVDKINEIIEKLPDALREKISDFIAIRFAPATAYENVHDPDFIDFPDIPELIEIPDQGEGVPYSEDSIAIEELNQIDEFLLKREDWRRRWENLPVDKREVFEQYIFEKLEK